MVGRDSGDTAFLGLVYGLVWKPTPCYFNVNFLLESHPLFNSRKFAFTQVCRYVKCERAASRAL